jgi:hypothetical protein
VRGKSCAVCPGSAPVTVEHMKPAHRRGTYQHNRNRVVATANSTPHAVCWRDGLTLAAHPPHRNGDPAKWEGGHTIDGAVNAPAWLNVTRRPPPGPWIAPEASTCNRSNGAHRTNTLRANPRSRTWLT